MDTNSCYRTAQKLSVPDGVFALPVRLEISTEMVSTAVLEAERIAKPGPPFDGTVTPFVSVLVAWTKTLKEVVTPVAVLQVRNAVVLAVIDDWARLQVPKIIPASVPFVLLPPTTKLLVLANPELVVAVVDA